MGWCAAARGHQRVFTIVLHPHHRELAHLAALAAARRDDDHGQTCVPQRIGPLALGRLVLGYLIPHPFRRTGLVFSLNWHAASIAGPSLTVDGEHPETEDPGDNE